MAVATTLPSYMVKVAYDAASFYSSHHQPIIHLFLTAVVKVTISNNCSCPLFLYSDKNVLLLDLETFCIFHK